MNGPIIYKLCKWESDIYKKILEDELQGGFHMFYYNLIEENKARWMLWVCL